MKQLALLLAFLLPVLLTACSNEQFQGRYVAPDGVTSYEFLSDGRLIIISGDDVTNAQYEYDRSKHIITLTADQALANDTITVNDEGNLETGDLMLSRGVDYDMLTDSTWIGHEGQYTFALTFTQTDKGMETFSELVSYYDDEMTYIYQTDDSITRLTGDKLLLDSTQYTVSDVTDNSLTLSIGNNRMQLKKHPKGTVIEFRSGYQSEDALPE